MQTYLTQRGYRMSLIVDSLQNAYRQNSRRGHRHSDDVTTATDLATLADDSRDHYFLIDSDIDQQALNTDLNAIQDVAPFLATLFNQEFYIRNIMVATASGVYYRHSDYDTLV